MAIVEIELPTDRCVVCNKKVAELRCRWTASSSRSSAARTTSSTVHGDTELLPGDVVIAFTAVEHEKALKKALTGS